MLINNKNFHLPLRKILNSLYSAGLGKSRIIQLDILRGVAILMVLGRHAVIEPKDSGFFQPLASIWFRFGWTGVDLFFVLSGFLIGGLLFKELLTQSSLDVRRFLIRRGFKILPLYFIYLAFLFVALPSIYSGGSIKQVIKALIPSFLNIQNYLWMPRDHIWSLAVEYHFYIGVTCLLWLITRNKKNSLAQTHIIPYVVIATLLGCNLLRLLTNFNQPYVMGTHLFPTHLRIDSLFFGVGLAYLYHFKSDWLKPFTRHYNSFLFLGILLISPMMFLELEKSRFVWTFGFTLLYLGYGCILLAMVYTPVSQGTMGRWFNSLPAQVIAFIGNFSYPIYLWHIDLGQNPLLELVSHGFLSNFSVSMRWFCVMMLFILVTVLTGTVLGIIVEKPSLALRDRLFPRRTDGIKQH